jgi:hypothetical protein
MRQLTAAGLAIVFLNGAPTHMAGQMGGSLGLTVKETAGIRRTEYPVGTRVTLPKGALADETHVRLQNGDTEVAGQYQPATRWDDGSVRELDVDFNLSLGAGESRAIRLEYGPAVTSAVKPRGGLAVTESDSRVQVGNIAFGKTGWPLLASVAYRGEVIASGPNGLTLTDAGGARHEFGSAHDVAMEVVKRGPLLVVVRYTARVPVGGADVPVTLTCEMPNSKSWVRILATADDPGRRVRGLQLETPLALAAFPWTWDFGTDTGTYGAFRAATDAAHLTQSSGASGNSWRVETGAAEARAVYEQSMQNRAATASGWGHVLDARNAVAFAMERFGAAAGTYSLGVDGQGHLALGFVRPQPASRHELSIALHFVGTPVAIGAATSPAAMMRPLVIETVRSGAR